jgi:hypothetical protein
MRTTLKKPERKKVQTRDEKKSKEPSDTNETKEDKATPIRGWSRIETEARNSSWT